MQQEVLFSKDNLLHAATGIQKTVPSLKGSKCFFMTADEDQVKPCQILLLQSKAL